MQLKFDPGVPKFSLDNGHDPLQFTGKGHGKGCASGWLSSFLTAHQHSLGYIVPHNSTIQWMQ